MDSPVQSRCHGQFAHYAASVALLVTLSLALIIQSGTARNIRERLLEESECLDPDARVNQLLTAAAEGETSDLADALESGIDVDSSGRGSWTPLMRAAAGGHVGCCE